MARHRRRRAAAAQSVRPLRDAGLPLAARWPVEMPARAWPPVPEPERTTRRANPQSADPLPTAPEITGYGSRSLPTQDDAETDLLEPDLPLSAPARRAEPGPGDPATRLRTLRRQAADMPDSVASMDWTIPAPARSHDPSPSRLAYRLNRLWLTPLVRHLLRVGLPLLLIVAVLGGWLAHEDNRARLTAGLDGLRQTLQNQPVFQVTSIDVQANSPEVALGVAQLLDVSFPISSWDLDLTELRRTAESLDAVERAGVQVRSGGVLEVRIEERMPAMIWRNAEGLDLVDANGHRVARLTSRAARADLPLIAGDGATGAIAEARLLWAAAAPLQGRVRGLVRMGNRRWDVMLDRNQRILLPADGALGALEWVIAQDATQQLLSRDIADVDMRNPSRPTLRLSADALAELNRNRNH